MIAMTKRHLKLYFQNKNSVFFSLLGALIAFILYIVFLQENTLSAWGPEANPEKMLDLWVMGGTLAVTALTTSWTGVTQLVEDKESHTMDDFLMTDTSFFKINMGYLISASLISFLMQVATFVLMFGYFAWQDDLILETGKFLPLLGLMVLNAAVSASLGLLVAQGMQRTNIADSFATILGAASGFFVGVYMPIGALPDFAQTLMKLTPGAYMSSVFRQVLLADQMVGWNQAESLDAYLGLGLDWNGLTSLSQNVLILALCLVGFLCLLLSILIFKKKRA